MKGLDAKLAALRRLDATSPEALPKLVDALRSKSGPLIAVAASQAGEHQLTTLADELVDAFERLLGDDATKRDPGCRGKVAIVRALQALNRWEPRVFEVGVRTEQREGWGGPDGQPPDDAAAELRGLCGFAYAQFLRDDALDVLATLLVDPERTTRVAAARSLGDAGDRHATAILRLKVLTGDADPDVLAACVESLLALHPDSSIPFALGLLDPHDELAEVTAIALGAARLDAAVEPLLAWCVGCVPRQRQDIAYVALALLRDPRANDYLLEVIRNEGKPFALAAARALATFRDEPMLAKIRDAASKRGRDPIDRELEELLR